jgi:hypothetical protein
LAVSVARVIWRDSLAKIADTKIIGIDTQWDIWYNLSSVIWYMHDIPQLIARLWTLSSKIDTPKSAPIYR